MFKRIHLILTFPKGLTKFPYVKSLYVEVHYAIIEYENGKAKLAHYPVQLVGLDDPNDKRQGWFPKN